MEVHDFAILGGLSAVHQFCRIGCHCMITGGSMIGKDVAPFTIAVAHGDRTKPVAINLVGLKRRGFSDETIRDLKLAFRIFFRSGLTVAAALERIRNEIPGTPQIKKFLEFFESSDRGFLR